MNKSDLNKIAKAITKAASKVDPKVKVAAGKMNAALGGARLVDDLVLDKIPGLKKAMTWADDKYVQGTQWLVDNTLGKIPGVGPILAQMHKKGQEVRIKVRNALFGENNPEWYEHLPQHVPFTIPGSYNNKSILFLTGNSSKTAIPSVATINLVRNIVTTPYATTSRYSEIYTAVKYARGLSYLSYNVNSLALMFEIGNEMAIQYYRLAKAVSAAFHYTLTKANLPHQIIAGLEVNDLIEHYADYVTLLDQMYNYMSVNVPMLPIMHSKLKQMSLFTALDSEKPAMSTYIQAKIFSNKIQLPTNLDGFYSDVEMNLRDISSNRQFFEYYVKLLGGSTEKTSQLLNVIADVKGSIQSVVYVDNWRSIKFEDTFTSNTLFLNSIKNMDLLPVFGVEGQARGSTCGRIADKFVRAYQGNNGSPINVATGEARSVVIRMKGEANADGPFTPQYICCSGSKEIKPFVEVVTTGSNHEIDLASDKYRFTNRLISLDGIEDTEGKVLETISLGFLTKKVSIEFPTENTPCYAEITVDPSLFIGLDITIANGYDNGEAKVLHNALNIPGWTTANDGLIMAWSLIDWMPAVRISNFVGANQWYTSQMWDLNGIGTLSYTAMETALDYITYSLLTPGNVEALNKVELSNKLIASMRSK